MNEKLDRSVWIYYFNEFSRRNYSRPTQLEVFGENGAQEAERGLSFTGISLERGNGSPAVEIMLGGVGGLETHMTHVISDVVQITPKCGLDGRDEAIEIVSAEGETSLLRFEPKMTIAN
jgi:hypothetical protein